MPSALPVSLVRGRPRKTDLLIDSTCFTSSSGDFDNLSDFRTESDPDSDSDQLFDLANPTNVAKMEFQNAETLAEVHRRKALSNGSLDTDARYTHPTLPASSFFTTLSQPSRFEAYIANEFPSVTLDNGSLPSASTNRESIRKEVNATMANTLLNSQIPTNSSTFDWIQKDVFPDDVLPVPFNEKCLDDVAECWDQSLQKFSHFPNSTLEQTVQDWLNHLAHTLGVRHGLIQKMQPSASEELTPASEELTPAPEEDMPASEEEVDGGGNHGVQIGDDADEVGIEEYTLDDGVPEVGLGFVVENAEDRSFSMISHKLAPTGGYRQRKPDIILLDRNLRHFLYSKGLRPRWHHVEAVVEVSSSDNRANMIRQILEKTALIFEAQPFRRFALALAFRGTANTKVEFAFFLVDRSGVCATPFTECVGYNGINLAHIIFGLSYAKPERLGIDTSMTRDEVSGNVTTIKVKDQEFNVVKHIHASLVLFGRGTHVFLVRDKTGQLHILKDAWLLVDHGISEIDVLSKICDILTNDSSEEAKTYRSVHPRFIVGEELCDSTKARRGRMTNTPPDRVHRRVVTGPVGDPLTSFRSRPEFVKVLLDCVKWLEYLHSTCQIVHGDLSVNNIVIFHAPKARPPLLKGTTTTSHMTTRATQTIRQQQQPSLVPAPQKGLDEIIPVVGTIIDYDYARDLHILMDRTSGTLPFMPLAALDASKRGSFIHGPAHDLESLLQTAIGIVSFTNGPCGSFRAPTDHVPVARWYNEIDREQLFKDKSIDLIIFEKEIGQHMTDYWKPFAPYLHRLVKATWPEGVLPSDNQASHGAYKAILEEAFDALTQLKEAPAKYAPATQQIQKRARATKGDDGRYPYKYSRGGLSSGRFPRPVDIKALSVWKDSVDA